MNRRNTKKYKENPWLKATALQTVTGTRIITAKGGNNSKLIISPETQEIEGITGFYTKAEVDKTHFLKLYANGIRALAGLSIAGMKVFMLIYDKVTSDEGYNRDTIILNYEMLEDEEKKMLGLRTFQRGITDLIKHEFLAETMVAGAYFINPTYIYNGNRLALVQEYICPDKSKSKREIREEIKQLAEKNQNESDTRTDTASTEDKSI